MPSGLILINHGLITAKNKYEGGGLKSMVKCKSMKGLAECVELLTSTQRGGARAGSMAAHARCEATQLAHHELGLLAKRIAEGFRKIQELRQDFARAEDVRSHRTHSSILDLCAPSRRRSSTESHRKQSRAGQQIPLR